MLISTGAAMRLGGGFVLAAVIAACGGTAASNQPATSAATTVQPASTASATPTEAAASTIPPVASVVVPSLGADTPLVDLLPDELGGTAMQKVALTGSDLSSIDPSAAMVFGSLQNVLGAADADMTIGAASNAKASVIAIRVKGKSAQLIGDAMIAGRALNATTTKDEVDLGGKHAVKVTTTTAPVPFYVYGSGDVSFTISATDETIVAEALSKLP
jgi:hypothetical protein